MPISGLAWAGLLTLAVTYPAAAQAPKVGVIDLYGNRRVPAETIRKTLGVKPGDRLPASKGDLEEKLETIDGIVRAHVEAACCEDGNAILYAGVEEKGAPRFEYHSEPQETINTPPDVYETYQKFLQAIQAAGRKGSTAEDLTNGHSLFADPETRALQLQFINLAAKHLDELRKVLRSSASREQRAIAAYVIGYSPKKVDVVNDLQWALQDADDTVRNHAIRSMTALVVFSEKHKDSGVKIAPTWFVEMLNSVVWTDRNNAAVALVNLTDDRNEGTLELLRERALPSLIEMAQWEYLPHALPAFIVLGRTAGVPEKELQDAWSRGDRKLVVEKVSSRKK